jgi:hypothetical protein
MPPILIREKKNEPHILRGSVVSITTSVARCGNQVEPVSPPLITASTSSIDTPRRLSIS